MKNLVEEHTQIKKQQAISKEIKRLTEKQNIPKSFLSQIAATYVSYPWWMRWSLGGLFAVAGGGIGFFVWPFLFPAISIFGAILGFLSYVVPTSVLKKHHQAELEYQQKLADEVYKLEAMLNDSIQTIQSLEKPIHALLDSLEQKNKERAHANHLFQTSIRSHKQQAEESEQAVQGLVETNEGLRRQNQKLSSVLEETAERHHLFEQTQKAIAQINEELQETKDGLIKDAEVFHDVTSHIAQRNDELDVLYQKFSRIEADAIKTHRAIKTHVASLNQPDSAPEHPESVEERQESTEALQALVLANLEQYLSGRKNRFFKEPTSPKRVASANEETLVHR